ncbi:phosphonatase-like hydrolase [Microbacterium karelineae]|uniref:phosphonatase-like hydrolase n=1 Tax=Microbacterium karelineae TaxID=2654283 RepID=UPI0012E9E2B6|nr:phosphonatase-like hydrolase [Microbacterium karelineae]
MSISLVCLDMAGTTVEDDGAVMDAFARAMEEVGIAHGTPERDRATQHTIDTMGQSKIDVFRAITGSDDRAHAANRAFESAYLDLIRGGAARPLPGAEDTIRALQEAGILVTLTTGFSPDTRDALLEELGWSDLPDAAFSPADAGRGRPFPNMNLSAVLRLGIDDVREVAVAGDTASDILAGLRAGASVVAGVRTGTHGDAEFAAAGATHVLDSVADLPGVLRTNHADVHRSVTGATGRSV